MGVNVVSGCMQSGGENGVQRGVQSVVRMVYKRGMQSVVWEVWEVCQCGMGVLR